MVKTRAIVRRVRLLAWAALALYALFLTTAPFEHHDLLCHIKTPLHCTACASSALGADTEVPPIVGQWALTDAGRAIASTLVISGTLLPVRSTGRSPPAFV